MKSLKLPGGVTPDRIRELAARHGAGNVRVFGSWGRGTGTPESDLDLLVDLEPGRDLIDLVELKQELEICVGRKVDVLTERALSPYLRDSILGDAVPL